MARVDAVAIIFVALLLLSGCQEAGPGGGPGTSAIEYQISIQIEPTDDIPNDAVIINASDERIAEADTLQTYFQKAVANKSTSSTHGEEINESDYEALRETFKSVPAYKSGERATVADSGLYGGIIYVYHEGYIYQIVVNAGRPG